MSADWYPLICPGVHLSGGSLVRELGVRVRVRVRQSRQVVVRRHRGGTDPRTCEPPDK